jgi:hypothetical protein
MMDHSPGSSTGTLPSGQENATTTASATATSTTASLSAFSGASEIHLSNSSVTIIYNHTHGSSRQYCQHRYQTSGFSQAGFQVEDDYTETTASTSIHHIDRNTKVTSTRHREEDERGEKEYLYRELKIRMAELEVSSQNFYFISPQYVANKMIIISCSMLGHSETAI